MKRSYIALLFAAALVASCGADDEGAVPQGEVAAAVEAPAGQQWWDTVAATPEGGWLVGNPNAPVKLVEYGSLGNLRISTYLGGTGDDFAWAIAPYGLGNTFVAGDTTSSDLQTADARQRAPRGNTDAFLMRIAVRGWA